MFYQNIITSPQLQETEVVIKDVQVKGGYIIHMGCVEGTIRVGDRMNLLIDTVRECTNVEHLI